MSRWNYGNAYLRYPICDEYEFDNGSKIKVHNIFDPLPEFMKSADIIFTDPPWNLGNLNTFYTKADRKDYQTNFQDFYKRLFKCIQEISPKICFIEVGKNYLCDFILEMKKIYKQVTFYNSSYYHQKENICYIIQGSNKKEKLPFDYIDEENIIKWICKNKNYQCIGDLCMGQGLVGFNAYINNKKFVGTELNHKRLSVLIEKIENFRNNKCIK